MNFVINLLRIITAIIAPISAFVLTILSAIKVSKAEGSLPEDGQHCLRCGEVRKGAEGSFYYTENLGNARERFAKRQLIPGDAPILGPELYFVCDQCARRYIRNEMLQMVLMVLPYPLYLYLIIPFFAENGIFANFLIETLLVVLSVGGLISAFDLFRAIRSGETPLAEGRDCVAIHKRKTALGKKFSYYTRTGISHIKKKMNP